MLYEAPVRFEQHGMSSHVEVALTPLPRSLKEGSRDATLSLPIASLAKTCWKRAVLAWSATLQSTYMYPKLQK